MTKARDLSKLLSTANGKIAGDNLDVSFENIADTGTEGTKVATGTTAQRGSTTGQLRFNTTTGLAEYYTGTAFKAIDAPPSISSVGNNNITQTEIDNGYDLSINGSGFLSGATIKFIGNDGTEYASPIVTVNSDTLITARVNTLLSNANEPYDVKITNISGLSNTLENAFNVDAKPAWTTASGNIVTVFETATLNTTVSATDPEGDTISYSETGDTILATNGFSLNSASGVISGTAPTVNGATTYSFNLRATSGLNSTDRAFNIIVNDLPSGGTVTTYTSGGISYRVHTFTSNGSFILPVNISGSILLVGGGGAGGAGTGGGGGAGGLIYIPSYSFTSGTWNVTIGQGGTNDDNDVGTNGENSIFTNSTKTLTALGGGYGGSSEGSTYFQSNSGGSGGGGIDYDNVNFAGGNATQPSNTSDGVDTYNGTGFGNQGGGGNNDLDISWGGGGAGGYPTNTSGGNPTYGGQGKQYDITGTLLWYAAGGQGGSGEPSYQNSTNDIGGSHNGATTVGTNGVANTGSGGGGGWGHSLGVGGNGGSGIVIVRYVF